MPITCNLDFRLINILKGYWPDEIHVAPTVEWKISHFYQNLNFEDLLIHGS